MSIYEELSEASRREILRQLLAGPRNVGELVAETGLKQPNISNHLARMRAKGVVRANKIGRQVFYSLATVDVENAVREVIAKNSRTAEEVQIHELSKEFAKAAVKGDESACMATLERVLRANIPLLDIYQDFLGMAMTTVGTWYKVDAIDEAQEHMASAITERAMAKTAQFFGPQARLSRMAVLGCAPNSWHVIGIRMLNDYLRYMGWKTQYLGANVPVDSFVSTVESSQPDLVLVSVASEEGVPDAVDLVRRLNQLRKGKADFLIGVGGGAVNFHPKAFREVGSDFTARDLKSFAMESLSQLDRLAHSSRDWSDSELDALQNVEQSSNLRRD